MKFFSLIYQGEVHPASDKKVIPAEEFSTLASASEVLEKAREDAVRLKQETEKECEELKEAAKQEGFDSGLANFNDHIMGFERELLRLRHELQKLVLPLALKAAKKIVARQLDLHPDTIVDIVMQALAPATQSKKVTIYVNKVDRENLEAQKPKIKAAFEQIQSLSLQDRPDVTPGGCIIETESGIINATIENQWRTLEAAFERYMKH